METSVVNPSAMARLVTLVVGPALLMSAAFLLVHADRRDYLGHFAAGYGATLAWLAIAIACASTPLRPVQVQVRVIAVTLVSLLMGTVLEASVFNLAQFDPVDLCNQSLGAVAAALAFLATRLPTPLPARAVGAALVVSALFVVVGFYYAFT
jgi:hypothetical protein